MAFRIQLAQATDQFANVIYYLVFIRVIMSWVIRDYSHPVVRFIIQVTEPILAPFRMLLERFGVGKQLDFSPILALLTIRLLANVIIGMII